MTSDEAGWVVTNRANWDERVAIHLADRTGAYGVARFLAGEETLHAIEAAELPDLRGLRVSHLQCHFGLDSLNLARRGARVTGLDYSAPAIAAARELATRADLDVRFVEGPVERAPALIGAPADLVYVTWGAINWLPDLHLWARAVADCLVPGGRLYLAEGHPAVLALEEVDGRLVATYDVPTPCDSPLTFDEATTYTGDATEIVNRRTFEWIHGFDRLFGALIAAGLRVDWFREHDRLVWRLFPMMVSDDDRHYQLPPGQPRVPLAFSLMATKRPDA
ncbi:MAG: class I SAM-dependent methyltransferase [Pseudomonadota bacterium]